MYPLPCKREEGNMTQKKSRSPGKAHRKGVSLVELCELFPGEEATRT